MRRLALPIFSSLLLVGCAGNLDNPEAFTGGTGGSTGRTVEAVFLQRCGNATGCHVSNGQEPDLVSPDVASRTVDLSSTSSEPRCGDLEIIVIAGDPDESYLMKKILDEPEICGAGMPTSGTIDDEDTEVIRQWIIDLGGVPGIINEGPDGGV